MISFHLKAISFSLFLLVFLRLSFLLFLRHSFFNVFSCFSVFSHFLLNLEKAFNSSNQQ